MKMLEMTLVKLTLFLVWTKQVLAIMPSLNLKGTLAFNYL